VHIEDLPWEQTRFARLSGRAFVRGNRTLTR